VCREINHSPLHWCNRVCTETPSSNIRSLTKKRPLSPFTHSLAKIIQLQLQTKLWLFKQSCGYSNRAVAVQTKLWVFKQIAASNKAVAIQTNCSFKQNCGYSNKALAIIIPSTLKQRSSGCCQKRQHRCRKQQPPIQIAHRHKSSSYHPFTHSQHLSTHALTGTKVAAYTMQPQHLSTHAITGINVAANTTLSQYLSAHALTGTNAAANTTLSQHLSAHAFTGTNAAANTMHSQHLSTHALTGTKAAAYTMHSQAQKQRLPPIHTLSASVCSCTHRQKGCSCS